MWAAMSQRRQRTAVGRINALAERAIPGDAGAGTPRFPLSPAREELRRAPGDGAAIPPNLAHSPQRRAGTSKSYALGGSLPATPRSVHATPRGEGTRVLTLDLGGNEIPPLRLPPADDALHKLRTHASGGEDADPERCSPGASRRRSGGSARLGREPQASDWVEKEKQIGELKRKFLECNEPKRSSFQNTFRIADIHKSGSLGREELSLALDQAGYKAEPEVLTHLLTTRARDRERLSFNDFMRFFDDRTANACLLKRKQGLQQFGDCAKMTHLWVPTHNDELGGSKVGALNDVLVHFPIPSSRWPAACSAHAHAIVTGGGQARRRCFSREARRQFFWSPVQHPQL